MVQDIIALAIVTLAALYLVRQWSQIFSREGGGCGGCSSCPAGEIEISPQKPEESFSV